MSSAGYHRPQGHHNSPQTHHTNNNDHSRVVVVVVIHWEGGRYILQQEMVWCSGRKKWREGHNYLEDHADYLGGVYT